METMECSVRWSLARAKRGDDVGIEGNRVVFLEFWARQGGAGQMIESFICVVCGEVEEEGGKMDKMVGGTR